MSRLLQIARREYVSYLRTPGFWISLLVAPLVIAFAGLAPQLMERATPAPELAIIDFAHSDLGAAVEMALTAPGAAPVRLLPPPSNIALSPSPEAAGRALRPYLTDGRLDAAAVLYGPPDAVRMDFWSRNLGDPTLEPAVRSAVAEWMKSQRLRDAGLDPRLLAELDRVQPVVREFSPKAAAGRVGFRDQLPAIVGLGLSFVLWMAVVTGAGILLNSVIEEKSTRVLEILLSSASVPEILGGKILGAAGLSATVLATWGALALAALLKTSPELAGDVAAALLGHGLIVWFALFFVGGYLMYASLFAAIGAFCETTREAQTLLGPLMLVLTIPMMFLTLALRHPDAPLIAALSWAPIFTPFLMTARIASGPPLWQSLGAIALMAATAALVVWGCARAFAAGALSSAKPDPKRMLRSLFAGVRG